MMISSPQEFTTILINVINCINRLKARYGIVNCPTQTYKIDPRLQNINIQESLLSIVLAIKIQENEKNKTKQKQQKSHYLHSSGHLKLLNYFEQKGVYCNLKVGSHKMIKSYERKPQASFLMIFELILIFLRFYLCGLFPTLFISYLVLLRCGFYHTRNSVM